MHDAYLVVTDQKTVSSLYEDLKVAGKTDFTLPFDFNNTASILDILIDHYSDMEDYEKCETLIHLKDV